MSEDVRIRTRERFYEGMLGKGCMVFHWEEWEPIHIDVYLWEKDTGDILVTGGLSDMTLEDGRRIELWGVVPEEEDTDKSVLEIRQVAQLVAQFGRLPDASNVSFTQEYPKEGELLRIEGVNVDMVKMK